MVCIFFSIQMNFQCTYVCLIIVCLMFTVTNNTCYHASSFFIGFALLRLAVLDSYGAACFFLLVFITYYFHWGLTNFKKAFVPLFPYVGLVTMITSTCFLLMLWVWFWLCFSMLISSSLFDIHFWIINN